MRRARNESHINLLHELSLPWDPSHVSNSEQSLLNGQYENDFACIPENWLTKNCRGEEELHPKLVIALTTLYGSFGSLHKAGRYKTFD
jgi:hypothetical protein